MQKFLQLKSKTLLQITALVVAGVFVVYMVAFAPLFSVKYNSAAAEVFVPATTTVATAIATPVPVVAPLDRDDYDRRMWVMANNGTSTQSVASSTSTTTKKFLWPVKNAPYPLPGAILPYHRIIAYYGNFYSTKMGVLGEYPRDIMFSKLANEVAKWTAADPGTPAIPAIDYIAVTAQGSPGADGKYRFRMPDSQLDHAIELADMVHGIVILDVQVGLSNLQSELPALEKYLKMPQVHLAIDPEFSIKTKDKPGDVIGTFSSADVNYAVNYLAKLVKDNNLPPKVLVVHRFTQGMVTGYKNITPLPEVQVLMDMDGWGTPAKKLGTYQRFVQGEPVQFTGFKLFYKNDLKKPSTRILTPEELLKLKPRPLFIQFQ